MFDDKTQEHIRRLRAAAFDTYDLSEVPRYLMEKTYINGEKWSFKDHEFQRDIVSDTSKVLYCQKAAQCGLTEIQMRYALALARMIPYFKIIMTWPFSGDADSMVKTRLNPIIEGSPDLRNSLDPELNNVDVKGIGTGLIYTRGTSGTTAGISTAADMLIHDEVDRSDSHALAQMQSRIKHSPYKMVRAFGTPTIAKHGIALLMETAKRKRHMCKCEHCNFSFVPSYHTDVKIPGFEGEKKEITKYTLPTIRWQEAILLCPRCGKAPSLQFDRREWVTENPGDNYDPVGYFVTPFSAPNIVSIPSLVKESTVFGTWTEFCNQSLGETCEDNDEQLTEEDLEACKTTLPLDSTELHNMGIDVGQLCHITVGRITQAGELLVVHKERCLVNNLVAVKRKLAAKYRIVMTVIDIQPETALVYQMQSQDKNLFGGLYHSNVKWPTYSIKMVDKNLKEGKLPINQASIHRNLNLDEVMVLIKNRKFLWQADGSQEDDLFVSQCLDMTRKQEVLTQDRGLAWVWKKTTGGQDHYHHATGYLHVACRLMPAASHSGAFTRAVPLMSTFRVKRQ